MADEIKETSKRKAAHTLVPTPWPERVSTKYFTPYCVLTAILVKDRVFDRARARATEVGRMLRGVAGGGLQVLGPAPAPLERLRGDYRVQLLIKAPGRREMQDALGKTLLELERRRLRAEDLVIDVDPISTL